MPGIYTFINKLPSQLSLSYIVIDPKYVSSVMTAFDRHCPSIGNRSLLRIPILVLPSCPFVRPQALVLIMTLWIKQQRLSLLSLKLVLIDTLPSSQSTKMCNCGIQNCVSS